LTQTASTFDSSSFGNQLIISMGSISFACSGRQWVDDMGWGTGPEVSRKSWADCGSLRLPTLIHVSPSAGGVRGQGEALPYAPRPYASRPGASSESPSPLSTSLPSRFSPGPRLLLASESLPGSVSSRRRETEAGGGAGRGELRQGAGRAAASRGGLRVPVITPPRGPRSRGGKNAKPKHLQNARTHASTRTQTRVRWWGAGVEREATMPLSPSPFPPPGADDVPRLQNLPRVERGAQWPCNSAVQQAPPCNRRPPKEREASRGQGLRGVGADRGGRGGAHSDFQVDDEILTMGLTR
jgi:hypothetical protein